MLNRGIRGTFAAACLVLIALVASGAISGASAASPCVGGGPAVSADGSKVYGSECSDRIVVRSPKVREVSAGKGNDVIFVNPDVVVVDGGEGDDVIYGELPETETGDPAAAAGATSFFRRLPPRPGNGTIATISLEPKNCTAGVSCYGGDGSQELIGSAGNDRIFGQRGNDSLYGNSGNDQLFGGVGDEGTISGGAGNDLLSGGLGTDNLNGNQESDLVRGDGTIDSIEDTGPSGTDTLSYATGVTPGFHGAVAQAGFPADANGEERGVSIRLDETTCEGEFEACDNDARYGGGLDNVSPSGFENVIGSPFADYIVGSNGPNQIDGGGGADVIYGRNGNDAIYGGPDGDYINGENETDTVDGQGGDDNCVAETVASCIGSAEAVDQRDRTKISVGYMVTSIPASLGYVELFLTGSTGADNVKAAYSLVGGTGYVTFTGEAGSAQFDTSADAGSVNCEYAATVVKCGLPKPLDAITLGGMAGTDAITLEGFPETTTPVLLGGEGNDTLTASLNTEDMLVDGNGSGEDILRAFSYDDALINNEGKDLLEGGLGNDLLLSAVNCDSDTIDGARSSEGDGAAVNSASWAKYAGGGVAADLEKGKAGDFYGGSGPACSFGAGPATLLRLDDLEGSSANDALYGDGADNNLLARLGKDELWGRAGNDRLEASGDATNDSGGGGTHTTGDSCVLDASEKANFAGCEKFPAP